MLIKKNDKGNIVEALYDSSNILSSNWNKITGELIITFKPGTQYLYKDVTNSDYLRFELADSQGVELNKRIKPEYEFEKMGIIDTTTLIKEIKETKVEEVSVAKQNLISVMKAFVEANEDNNKIIIEDIENIEFFINELKNAKNNAEK